MAGQFRSICFSDIDGTLVHYLDDPQQVQEVQDVCVTRRPADRPTAHQRREHTMPLLNLHCAQIVGELHWLPASTTGRQGIISQASLAKAAALRQQGAAFAILSGARTSTVLQRLPFLPAADAIVAENGGRIWFPDPQGLTACPLREDLGWRQQLSDVTGPVDQDGVAPLDRKGLLWDWYRQLYREGWQLDCSSYSTCFRMLKTPGRSPADVAAAVAARPPGLTSTVNLGVVDFYPAASGKEGAAGRLMELWGVPPARCAFLCDDDNDLPLAGRVARAFLPSVSAPSVEAAVAADPARFVVADTKWTGGTEQMLDAAAAFLRGLNDGDDGGGEEGRSAAAVAPATAATAGDGRAEQQQQQHAAHQ